MTAPLHGTSQGDPPHRQPGDRVRFTVEGTMDDGGYVNVHGRTRSWSISPNLLRHGTVEVIASPLPPIPEDVGVVVQDPRGRLWTRWDDAWHCDGSFFATITALLGLYCWTRADLTIVSLPVPS